MPLLSTLLLALPLLASAYAPACAARSSSAPAVAARACRPVMDETIIQKALAGELEAEGAENVFMSELGWATYLDKEAGSSYAMNERPSQASDGYFTADVFSNPIDGAPRPEDARAQRENRRGESPAAAQQRWSSGDADARPTAALNASSGDSAGVREPH
jgi:hypothetical protein